MSWCVLEMTCKGASIFKLFQSFSVNPDNWKLSDIHDVEEKAFNYIISNHHGNTDLVYKGCEGATEQTDEAIAEWKKDVEDVIPNATIVCTTLADFVDRFKTERKRIEFCFWRILKMTDEQGTATFKLFRAFSRGENDWLLNSGITKIDETPESYIVHGVSDSEYEVAKKDEGDSAALEVFVKQSRRGFLQVGMMNSTVEIASVDEYRKELKV